MSAKSRTNVYLDLTTKQQAIQVLKEYGLGLSDAINIFLKQVVLEKGIPFKPVQPNRKNKTTFEEFKKQVIQSIDNKDDIPNDTTLRAIWETEQGINLEEATFEQLKEEAKACIVQ